MGKKPGGAMNISSFSARLNPVNALKEDFQSALETYFQTQTWALSPEALVLGLPGQFQ
jgi:hypothetical protein